MAQQLVPAEKTFRAAVLAAGHEALVLFGVGLVDPGVPAEVRSVLEGAGAGGVRAGMSWWRGGRSAGDGASGALDRGHDGGARRANEGGGWASEADGWAGGIGKDAGVDVGEGVVGVGVADQCPEGRGGVGSGSAECSGGTEV